MRCSPSVPPADFGGGADVEAGVLVVAVVPAVVATPPEVPAPHAARPATSAKSAGRRRRRGIPAQGHAAAPAVAGGGQAKSAPPGLYSAPRGVAQPGSAHRSGR